MVVAEAIDMEGREDSVLTTDELSDLHLTSPFGVIDDVSTQVEFTSEWEEDADVATEPDEETTGSKTVQSLLT